MATMEDVMASTSASAPTSRHKRPVSQERLHVIEALFGEQGLDDALRPHRRCSLEMSPPLQASGQSPLLCDEPVVLGAAAANKYMEHSGRRGAQ